MQRMGKLKDKQRSGALADVGAGVCTRSACALEAKVLALRSSRLPQTDHEASANVHASSDSGYDWWSYVSLASTLVARRLTRTL